VTQRPAVLAGPGRVRRAIAAHLGSHDVSRVIYGAIIGLALVVALEAHPPTTAQAIAAIAGTAVAVGLAEVYSEVIGIEARTRRHVPLRQVRAIGVNAGAVIFGAGFPVAFFVLAAAGVFDIGLAFTLSKWTGLGLIGAYGYVAARLAGEGVRGALVHAAAVGAIGGALIALKALLH
jgi:hypothetical protein